LSTELYVAPPTLSSRNAGAASVHDEPPLAEIVISFDFLITAIRSLGSARGATAWFRPPAATGFQVSPLSRLATSPPSDVAVS
jgi:hypothetical protein